MRIVVEPERLEKLASTALLYKSSPILDAVPVYLSEKGAIIKDSSLQVLAIYSVFPKHFFLEFEAKEGEKLVITKSLHKMIKQGFRGVDAITIMEENGKIVLRSRNAMYSEPIPEIEEISFSMSLKKNEELNIYLPEDFVPSVVVILKDSDFDNLLGTDYYVFEFDGSKLKITSEDVGSYTKIITPTKTLKSGTGTVRLDGDLTRRIIANITGDVILAFNEEIAIFERITAEYVQIFILAAIAPAAEEVETITSEVEEKAEGEIEEISDLSEKDLEDIMSEVA